MSEQKIVVSSILLLFLGGVTSLRDVRLTVDPPVVVRGGTASLICERDMEGAPLYSVKWYRGNHEFYRYTPNELPTNTVFSIPGIYVDVKRSNGSQVVLRRMDLSLAGNFSCEVTADSPSFVTKIATVIIEVVSLPKLSPVMTADKDRYESGEMLRANCSSSPSRPAANLTIYINEEPLRSTTTGLHPSDTGLQWTSTHAELKVTPQLFIGGRLRLACTANIYNVYNRTATLDFFTPDTDPRPERITFSRSSQLQSWIFLIFLFLMPLLVMSEDYGIFEDSGIPEIPELNGILDYEEEEIRNHAIMSLVGD